MKKIIILILLTVSVYTFAQDIKQENVPPAVVNTFQQKFANATDVDWELHEGLYQVEFEINDKDHEVTINNEGNIVKHEQEMWESEIPQSVVATIKTKCKFFDIEDAEKTEENGNTTFYIGFDINGKDYDFWLNGKGKLIKYKQELADSEIPDVVMAGIQKLYVYFELEDAEKREDGGKVLYDIEIEIKDKDHDFIFDNTGKMLIHKQKLWKSEIPRDVMTTLNSSYSGFQIRDADKTEEGNKTIYDLRLKKSKEKIRVIFNSKGEVLESAKG